MIITPAELFTLALKRHQQPWNWSLQFSALWLFGLTLLFHSYLLLAVTFIIVGTGFFQLNLPKNLENRWFSFVEEGIEWEKNWIAAPWNFYKWKRFLFVLFVAGVLVWALWSREYASLLLITGFAYLVKVMVENKSAGIEP